MADKEELIKEYNSYNTNLTQQDIVLAFPGNVISYLSKSHFYLCNYIVYQGESEQNYAWHFKIIKNSYKWGTVYTLQMHISNGFFYIKASTDGFNVGDESAECLDYWTFTSTRIRKVIVREFKSFVQESLITLKQYNRNYDIESQKALTYVITEFLSELSPNRKGEREIENEMAEREAYLAAMRRAMRRSWDD